MNADAQAIGDEYPPDTCFECRICWYVYDPAAGDEIEQVPPGTAFDDLPERWRCPQCDSERTAFLRVSD